MTNCANCGVAIDGNSHFCSGCGTPLVNCPQPPPVEAAEHLSPNILRGSDGVYRWVYELSLFKNPTILFMLWKIFGGIFAGIYLFVFILQAADFGLEQALEDMGLFPVWFLLGMVVLTSLSYAVYALIMGGSYCVLFEMDDEGVKHTQLSKQFKKAQVIGKIGFWMGLAAGNLSMAGQGLITASRQSMHTSFSSVKRIVPLKRRGVIKLNETLHRNHVYAEMEDFDAVFRYIGLRCQNTKQ